MGFCLCVLYVCVRQTLDKSLNSNIHAISRLHLRLHTYLMEHNLGYCLHLVVAVGLGIAQILVIVRVVGRAIGFAPPPQSY